MTAHLAGADEPPRHDRDVDDLDVATSIVASVLLTARHVAHERRHDPDAFPGYGDTPTCRHVIARRAVAALLNDGWTPPGKYGPSKDPIPDVLPTTWTRPPWHAVLAGALLRGYARLLTRLGRPADGPPPAD